MECAVSRTAVLSIGWVSEREDISCCCCEGQFKLILIYRARGLLTSTSSVHLSGKSSSAISATLSATCARIGLSDGLEESAIIAGTSDARRFDLSFAGRALISCSER